MRRAVLAVSFAALTACGSTTGQATTEPPSEPTPEATSQPPSRTPSAQMLVLTGAALLHADCWDEPVLLEGQEIRIRNEAGELIAVGTVGDRRGDSLNWEVEVEVPEARFYVIEVGADDTEDQTLTPAELADGDVLLVANPPSCD